MVEEKVVAMRTIVQRVWRERYEKEFEAVEKYLGVMDEDVQSLPTGGPPGVAEGNTIIQDDDSVATITEPEVEGHDIEGDGNEGNGSEGYDNEGYDNEGYGSEGPEGHDAEVGDTGESPDDGNDDGGAWHAPPVGDIGLSPDGNDEHVTWVELGGHLFPVRSPRHDSEDDDREGRDGESRDMEGRDGEGRDSS
ncbi:hypothetical protein PMIN06_004467 [Paraphaeosphaeria minitans]|uniref:Uncharacterized protein n=1 Tax=Paraphaeosphaeria minitans TaxID=565426 RepID=A0A9P6GF29_9PLEO|nr:hypothetical protein PMIN01_07122 [Paraphaeosphaeria minitans]